MHGFAREFPPWSPYEFPLCSYHSHGFPMNTNGVPMNPHGSPKNPIAPLRIPYEFHWCTYEFQWFPYDFLCFPYGFHMNSNIPNCSPMNYMVPHMNSHGVPVLASTLCTSTVHLLSKHFCSAAPPAAKEQKSTTATVSLLVGTEEVQLACDVTAEKCSTHYHGERINVCIIMLESTGEVLMECTCFFRPGRIWSYVESDIS